MQSQKNKVISHYSLSPQKPKKFPGSRLIVIKNPITKLTSPQSFQSDFQDYSHFKSVSPEKQKTVSRVVSPYKMTSDSRNYLNPALDLNKFLFPISPPPTLAVISLREAMRDRDWVIRAKEDITRRFSEILNASCGLKVENNQGGFKYYIGKGNNSGLIKQCLNSRWWWSEDTMANANFIWTQCNLPKFFENHEHLHEPPKEIDKDTIDNTVYCNVHFQSDTLEEKVVEISCLNYDMITKSQSFLRYADLRAIGSAEIRTCNKLEFNTLIADKKNLYYTMKKYYEAVDEDIFNSLPLTFHIKSGETDPEFIAFTQAFCRDPQKKTIWILKPGENSNRGNGIMVCNSLEKIKAELGSFSHNHTCIIQKYIEKPYLVHKRKFDIRLYTLITSTNGVIQCYFYQEGYIRTSCKDYSTKSIDNKFVHLTNDAVQKRSEDYGKYENGNKMSYKDFQKYLDSRRSTKSFFNDILPDIKKIVTDTVNASFLALDKNRRLHTFEILGYDFLLDSDLKPWLLEINSNPCLELSSTILARIIPAMVENALKIALDPMFPEPSHSPKRTQAALFQDLLPENKFELIFHEAVEGKLLIDELRKKGTLDKFLAVE